MRIDSLFYQGGDWQVSESGISDGKHASVVFLFGDSDVLRQGKCITQLRERYPQAHLVGTSSSGNILGTEIMENPAVATAVEFEKGHINIASADFTPDDDISLLAQGLVSRLDKPGLKHVFLLSDGLNLNGSDLAQGLNNAQLNSTITGGMAGDGANFSSTWVVADDAGASECRIVALGFYGDELVISSGCFAGWSEFGADRVITRSKGNILYELNGEPALDLYKSYLGEYAADLPLSGMRFPLSIRETLDSPDIIRTLLAIDEAEKSITFAGNVPEGYIARLMKPDVDKLIDGAGQAARSIIQANSQPALGLVVSCVGRKLVMNQLVEEELESIDEVLGDNVHLTGFYSYGEIAPFPESPTTCQLHNQTMTLTVIYENR